MTKVMASVPQACFSWPVRVYIEDTDAGGIVFYANYLKYMERARTEFVRSKGIQLRQWMAEDISFVVHSLDVQYLKPARLDEELRVTASLKKLARSYMIFEQTVCRDNDILVTGQVKVACVELATGKPRPMPQALSLLNS